MAGAGVVDVFGLAFGFGFAAGLTATVFFLVAGFLSGLSGGGAGVNSTVTGLGRISGTPEAEATGSISADSG